MWVLEILCRNPVRLYFRKISLRNCVHCAPMQTSLVNCIPKVIWEGIPEPSRNTFMKMPLALGTFLVFSRHRSKRVRNEPLKIFSVLKVPALNEWESWFASTNEPKLKSSAEGSRNLLGLGDWSTQFLAYSKRGGTVCSNGFYAEISNQQQMQQCKSSLKSFLSNFGSFKVPYTLVKIDSNTTFNLAIFQPF